MNDSFDTVCAVIAFVLLLTLVAGLLRVWRGPEAEDRMLAAQLFGTTGVGIMLVLSVVLREPALRNVALVLAVLAVLAVVAFVGRVGADPANELPNTPTRRPPPHRGDDDMA
jgi:multicomponent Na+:H+ antiporter subunit F